MHRASFTLLCLAGLAVSSVRADFVYTPGHGDLSATDRVMTLGTGFTIPGAKFRTDSVLAIDDFAVNFTRVPGEGGAVSDGANDEVEPTGAEQVQIQNTSGVCGSFYIVRNDTVFWPHNSKSMWSDLGGHIEGGAPSANSDCSTLGSWTDKGNSSGASPLNISSNGLPGPSDGQFVSWCGQGKVYTSGGSPNGEASKQYEFRRTWNAGSGSCTDEVIELAENGRRRVISRRRVPAT